MTTATQQSIQTVIDNLARGIKQGLSRPIYLRVIQLPKGEFEVKQIEFLTVEQLADLAHVETRTVYSWVEKAQENGLKFYRAPGTRGVLFEINEVLEWIRNAV